MCTGVSLFLGQHLFLPRQNCTEKAKEYLRDRIALHYCVTGLPVESIGLVVFDF